MFKNLSHQVKITVMVITISMASLAETVSAKDNIPPEVQKMHAFLGLMQQFYGIVDSMDHVSNDPTKAAIMQMFKIQEIYEQRGEKAKAAEVFSKVLKDTKSPALRNAASIMLGDLLKDTGQHDAAIKVLSQGLNENVKRAK